MCCHLPLTPTLGGAKVYIEAAASYKYLGHIVTLVGVDEVVGSDKPFMDENWRVRFYPQLLKEYLLNLKIQYDVIEYESIYLPFDLKFHIKSLFVARSVLLDLHLRTISIPRFKGFKAFIGSFLKSRARLKKLNQKIDQSIVTMNYADFVNVPNPCDKKLLIENGILAEKIIVQPYGISTERLNYFQSIKFCKLSSTKKKKIAFVGTFDNRKGAVEFPQIIKRILVTHPDVEFKLLGVMGMFPSEKSIYDYIGDEFKSRVHIYGQYSAEKLPELLKDCSYGIFPSYLESFGFGVLEMMAMDLPVIGYNSPGINLLLLKELTVSPGNVEELLKIFSKLITNEEFSRECIKKCRSRVNKFIYEAQENLSIQNYQKKIQNRETRI